ncbi:MAG: metallophosphoesterase [Bacteroidales bacterium]|nr:metallophosphoesterase [Bacteroidales bacterium]
MKRIFSIIIFAALCVAVNAQNVDYKVFKKHFNFYVANDLGRNGYYEQPKVAELMGEMAEKGVDPEFVAAAGDVHHFLGVQSVFDPLWQTNYEHIYKHPELMIPWYPVCGNHEYRGNTSACIEYSNISRRWCMENRYYAKSFKGKGTSILVVFLDTPPLIDKYVKDTEQYRDACFQDVGRELMWLDYVLANATEQWVVVIGHHPIYAQSSKAEDERTDMQARVGSILERHRVDMYINGHLHNFQHIRKKGSTIDYVTNSSGSLSREVEPQDGTVFCSPKAGFSIVSANSEELVLRMIGSDGELLHEIVRTK